jgi:hypothetical protein|tara:strand:- start:1838 stop:2680 length:843 start_codon:yes stop_codon:yes gene_type:complete
MGLNLKSLLPIAGAAAGFFLGGPAGSAAMNAALGSGIGTLVAGGKPKDAIMNAILAGGAGAGLGAMGVQGAGAAQAAGGEAVKQAAVSKAAQTAATETAAQTAATETAKSGIFGTGITGGDIYLGSNLLALTGIGDEDITDGDTKLDPRDLESRPDYQGELIGGLFMDSVTGIAYDTAEELEDAVMARREESMNMALGGIITLKEGGSVEEGGYVEGPGNGTSDSVNAGIYQNGKKVQEARLSDGEFVFKEKSVVGAGNGNRELGAKRLYAMMDKFERMA